MSTQLAEGDSVYPHKVLHDKLLYTPITLDSSPYQYNYICMSVTIHISTDLLTLVIEIVGRSWIRTSKQSDMLLLAICYSLFSHVQHFIALKK